MAAIKTKLKLLEMFDNYNKKYWNSSLPRVNIVIEDIPKTYGEYWCPDNKKEDYLKKYKIIINARMHWRSKKSMRKTLLHEMCHHSVFVQNKEKVWNKEISWHGKEWKNQMKKVGFKEPIDKYS